MTRPFEDVVREHGATVLRVCRSVLGARDADDAWSETFLAALRAWPELPGDANVEAWLVTIARRRSNECSSAPGTGSASSASCGSLKRPCATSMRMPSTPRSSQKR